MAKEIHRDDVRKMIDAGEAQLIEVLPAREYKDQHLPKAIGTPLGELTEETARQFTMDQPIIVYCYDYQ
jgi:rhodanese-related sulfurtransferase